MTERWRLYLTPEERETMRDIETAARMRMALDDERRGRAVAADPLLAANGGDGAWEPEPVPPRRVLPEQREWVPSTDYGDDDAT